MTRQYKLRCQACHKEFDDDGFRLECDSEHEPALLITKYTASQLEVNLLSEGIYRYQDWLPILRPLPGASRTITYQSACLSQITKLPHLWIAFNGYWPEKGATLETTTFKELEAYTVLSRLPECFNGVLVVASAGNTAAAFAHACSQSKLPCLIIIPAGGLHRLRFTEPLDPCVKIVSLTGCVDYYDAIHLADQVAKHDGFVLEGGVKNVARRDGLGTTLLSAVETMEQLPDYYFQAIGSGAGGIAVHETAKKLVQDGRFGQHYPHLMLSQNIPFTPIYHSWKTRQRSLIDLDRSEGKKQIQQIAAYVLSNQRPPYAVKGGVFDVLKESQGDMLAADNSETLQAMHIFKETERIDIDPAAGVAFATLLKEVTNGHINQDAYVLLNITGGGWERRQLDHSLVSAQLALQINEYELALDQAVEKVVALFC